MSILKIISKIPVFKQSALVIITPTELKAENLQTGVTYTVSRSSTHPRTLAFDFYKMEVEIKETLHNISLKKWIKPSLVLALSGCDEGGYTNIECRAFLEAAYGASGAINVIISENLINSAQAIKLLNA